MHLAYKSYILLCLVGPTTPVPLFHLSMRFSCIKFSKPSIDDIALYGKYGLHISHIHMFPAEIIDHRHIAYTPQNRTFCVFASTLHCVP
jgi:hypothetical protein